MWTPRRRASSASGISFRMGEAGIRRARSETFGVMPAFYRPPRGPIGRSVTAAGEAGDRGGRDPLTGLLCRAALVQNIQAELEGASERVFAVAVVDLDGFRAANQILGYAAGDRLLHASARRLETCLRRGDTLVRF